MRKLLLTLASFAIATAPLTSVQAKENINLYGWQNWSYEWVDADNGRDYDRLSNNAANIGFMSHMDTGIAGLQVGLRCEQFTYWGRLNQYTNWCNRNSKISLRHEQYGELMFGQWLLPFNEIVAQWIDPFYDAGADSHTSIMGNIGGRQTRSTTVHNLATEEYQDGDDIKVRYQRTGDYDDDGVGSGHYVVAKKTLNDVATDIDSTEQFTLNRAGGGLAQLFYNGSFDNSSDFTDAYGALSFNRRQEGVVQYVWPNTSDMASQSRDGFQFRFAVTEGSDTDKSIDNVDDIDPRIYSMGASYQRNMHNGDQWWFAVAFETHKDYSISRGLNLEATRSRQVGVDTDNDDAPIYVNEKFTVVCDESDDDAFRVAGRYIHDWGNGMKTQLGAMWEQLDYDADCDNEGADNTNRPYWSGVERDAWMISGKHWFGNGVDFRFSYMDADEWECDNDTCTDADEDDTDASAYNVGLFYTMPAGTELRATFSQVQNEDNAGYDFGINGGGVVVGEDIDMFAIGIVHWFD